MVEVYPLNNFISRKRCQHWISKIRFTKGIPGTINLHDLKIKNLSSKKLKFRRAENSIAFPVINNHRPSLRAHKTSYNNSHSALVKKMQKGCSFLLVSVLVFNIPTQSQSTVTTRCAEMFLIYTSKAISGIACSSVLFLNVL